MGMLPKGFGRDHGNADVANYYEIPDGCVPALCPICKREFYSNEDCKICNMCSMGMVWNDKKKMYTYYPGLDKSKQNKDGV